MTRKEAIRRMECCRDFLANNYSDMGEPNVTAFNMAIKALEQKPCTDAISRSAVIEMIKYMDNNGFVTRSVNHVVDDIRTLPSVTPTRKIGKWKDCGEREPWYIRPGFGIHGIAHGIAYRKTQQASPVGRL